MHRVVMLFGNLLKARNDTPRGSFVLDVDPQLGDAPEFRLAGQITFAERQCVDRSEPRSAGERAVIRIPEHIARYKSDLTGNIRQRKRR